jgi:hypothetical protein
VAESANERWWNQIVDFGTEVTGYAGLSGAEKTRARADATFWLQAAARPREDEKRRELTTTAEYKVAGQLGEKRFRARRRIGQITFAT